MRIELLKGKDKPPTLTCVRADGTRTWSRLQDGFGPRHDLAHYAVESTLGFADAFYGLLAQGRTIEEFGETEDKSWIGDEALLTEAIVMALQHEAAGTIELAALPEFVAQSCETQGIEVPSRLTPEVASALRERCRELWVSWAELAPGETLELDFPDPG